MKQDMDLQKHIFVENYELKWKAGHKLDGYNFNEETLKNLGIKNSMSHSNDLWERGKKVIPCGTQTLGKSPIGFIDGVAPKYLSHGEGGRVWDVDGNEYIDCWLACLPIHPMGITRLCIQPH